MSPCPLGYALPLQNDLGVTVSSRRSRAGEVAVGAAGINRARSRKMDAARAKWVERSVLGGLYFEF